ncbi:MAG: SDR family oxidoreductase [Deltaproteobacteria bacterium]|nr:SDR family oxidoreductase [Deltaproteobacteria bacterium]MBW2110107.1 SDR family oxidoreductase [Deltaproteobacteria bacterium]HDZ89498.1 SDR family oxidoreductase [Deltaproteobacteria bacterium]
MGLDIFDLTGKVAMVTGSTRGLGEVEAMALAKAGADVAVCGRVEDDLKRVSGAIRDLGRDSAGFFLEATSKESIHECVDGVLQNFGRVDILVNNTGTNHRVPALGFPEDKWDLIINTNLKSYYLVAQAVVPQMIERGYGKVINISSIVGQVAIINQLAYGSAKGGVNEMTRIMALEWAKSGVRVNAIAPTYFETDMVKQIRDDPERFKFINERTPMGRWGKLHELEGIVIFMAAPASDFITGQIICIDGGWTAC